MRSQPSSGQLGRRHAWGSEDERPGGGKYASHRGAERAVAILNELLRVTGDTVESLFRKSLDLYRLAVEAKLDGYKLAIVDADDNEVVRDIGGGWGRGGKEGGGDERGEVGKREWG